LEEDLGYVLSITPTIGQEKAHSKVCLFLSTNEGIIHRRLVNPIARKLGELGAETGRDMTTLRSAAKPLLIRTKNDSELAKRIKEMSDAVS
jgi:hypothetical protein